MKKRQYLNEIKARGFETEFRTGFAGSPASRDSVETIKLAESRRGLRLYELEGWKKYSRHTVYHTRFVYLAGIDRGVYWAIRCPSTVTNIAEALEYTTPAKVKKAKSEGRKVYRQGDVFIIEKKAGKDNLNGLPSSHSWDSVSRNLTHTTHKSVKIDFPFCIAVGKSVNSKAD